MNANKNLYTSLLISLIIHGLAILLIPARKPKADDLPIGGRMDVEFFNQSAASPAKPKTQDKKIEPAEQIDKQEPEPKEQPPRPPVPAPAPVPEIDPSVVAGMGKVQVRDIPTPMADFSLPGQPKESLALSAKQPEIEEEFRIEEEDIISQPQPPEQAMPLPKPVEIEKSRKEEDLPKPRVEESDFDEDKLEQEMETDVIESSSTDSMDIQWQGKPRQIVYKPPYPPTYPPGYAGHEEGKIRLQFWVDADGFVVRVRPMQKLDPRLDAVATEYLRKYQFERVDKNSAYKTQWGIIPFSFRLR